MCSDEQTHFQLPPLLEDDFFEKLEDAFTANDFHELLSLLQFHHPTLSPSGSSESTNRCVYSVEERKRRRLISNRESARRSRWRKKRQIEVLTNQLNWLKIENRELKNKLFLARHECHVVQMETDRLIVESIILQKKLAGLSQTLAAMPL